MRPCCRHRPSCPCRLCPCFHHPSHRCPHSRHPFRLCRRLLSHPFHQCPQSNRTRLYHRLIILEFSQICLPAKARLIKEALTKMALRSRSPHYVLTFLLLLLVEICDCPSKIITRKVKRQAVDLMSSGHPCGKAFHKHSDGMNKRA